MRRLGLAIALLILVPVGAAIPAWVSLAIIVIVLWALVIVESRGYGPTREQIRHEASPAHQEA